MGVMGAGAGTGAHIASGVNGAGNKAMLDKHIAAAAAAVHQQQQQQHQQQHQQHQQQQQQQQHQHGQMTGGFMHHHKISSGGDGQQHNSQPAPSHPAHHPAHLVNGTILKTALTNPSEVCISFFF